MKKKICTIALIAMMLGGVGLNALPTQTASAAWRETTPLTESILSGTELKSSEWVKEDYAIYLENNKIVFDDYTWDDATLFYQQELYARVEKSTYTIEATIEVEKMTANKSFGLGFGFQGTVGYVVGQSNTNYFYIKKGSNDGYVAGLASYNASGAKTEHLPTPFAINGSKCDIKLVATYPNNVTAYIDSEEVFSGSLTSKTLNGFFGFIEMGRTTKTEYSKTYVSKLSVTNNYYVTPTNANINDDFSGDTIDASVWSLYEFDEENTNLPVGEQGEKKHLGGIAVADGMLQFIDAYEDTLSTRDPYSNFEMRLDIPYVRKQVEYNTDGTIRRSVSAPFGIFCGIEVDNCASIKKASLALQDFSSYCLTFQNEDYDKDNSPEPTVRFGDSKDEDTKDGRKGYILPKKYDLWDMSNEGKVLNVVFTCMDGTYNLELKWSDETWYYKVFPNGVELPDKIGYISLFGLGGPQQKVNVAFDNIKITNRDYKGDIRVEGFPDSNNALKNEGDYGYADSKSPAQLVPDGTDFDGIQAVGDSGSCSSVIDIGGVSIATLAVATAFITRRRKRK